MILFALFFSCKTAEINPDNSSRLAPDSPPAQRARPQVQPEINEPPTEWHYGVEVTNSGTRSEGKIGHLFFRDLEIPGIFDEIIIRRTRYEYYQRSHLWDFAGYVKDSEYKNEISFQDEKICDTELKNGWYYAHKDEKKKNTPENWVWVRRENIRAFINPEKIVEFVKKHQLSLRGLNLLKVDPVWSNNQ